MVRGRARFKNRVEAVLGVDVDEKTMAKKFEEEMVSTDSVTSSLLTNSIFDRNSGTVFA